MMRKFIVIDKAKYSDVSPKVSKLNKLLVVTQASLAYYNPVESTLKIQRWI